MINLIFGKQKSKTDKKRAQLTLYKFQEKRTVISRLRLRLLFMSFNEGDFEMDPTKQNPEIKRNDESFEIGPNDVTPDLREVPDEQTPEEEPLVNITGKKITEVFPSLEDDEIVLEDIPEKKRNDA